MSLFGGRREGGHRTSADREAARVERERRRAEREGRPLPQGAEDDDPGAPARGDGPPFEWDRPDAGAPAPEVRRGREPEDPEPEPEASHEPDPEPRYAREPEPPYEPDPEPRYAREPEPPYAPDPEPRHAPEPEPADPEPDPAPPREPTAWSEPPAGGADPRAQAWQARVAPAEEDGRAADADEAGRGGGSAAEPDPQATQPFDALGDGEPTIRRTVSLPRPQTESSEWDAPIGTVRVSRGGGRYQAQPGAPGYPPYRKLVTKPRRRWLRRIVAFLALAIAVAAVAFLFLLFQPFHGAGSGTVRVAVPTGATARDIGDLLAERGVVRSGFLFALRARLSGQRAKLRSGAYALKHGMPYSAALTALTTAPKAAPVVNVTLPEGPSRREEAARLRRAGIAGSYLAATRSSPRLDPRDYGAPRSVHTLEGFLFPSTYELKRSDATARRLVGRQLDAFKANFAKVDLREAKRKNLSRYDVLIIASMIEREALAPRDRRLIAAVIYNRLRRDMPLGIDATLRYALNQWSRPLRVSELNSRSAFNTRRRQGLPPTPIGNPGLAAMRAAANPANVPYLFYVVKPCGNGAHAFSSTDAQFQRDVQRYNRARQRRGGKDPSRC